MSQGMHTDFSAECKLIPCIYTHCKDKSIFQHLVESFPRIVEAVDQLHIKVYVLKYNVMAIPAVPPPPSQMKGPGLPS